MFDVLLYTKVIVLIMTASEFENGPRVRETRGSREVYQLLVSEVEWSLVGVGGEPSKESVSTLRGPPSNMAVQILHDWTIPAYRTHRNAA